MEVFDDVAFGYRKTSTEKRSLVMKALRNGVPKRTVALTFDIPIRSINRWLLKLNTTGIATRGDQGGHKPKLINEEELEFIKELIDDKVEITLLDIQTTLQDHGIKVSLSCISKAIEGFNYSWKRVAIVGAKDYTTENIELRLQFCHWIQRIDILNRNLIFLDETDFKVGTRCTHGRAKLGVAPVIVNDNIRTRNITVFAAMYRQG
jgi:transposase